MSEKDVELIPAQCHQKKMGCRSKQIFATILALLVIPLQSHSQSTSVTLAESNPFASDFNFHDSTFLQEKLIKLVYCINGTALNEDIALKKTNEGSPTGEMRFVFEYNGTRGYKESCLGDVWKGELFHKIYDAHCATYEDKVKFLDQMSCDASQNLECRQVGVEATRSFGAQATPIMQCLCPDFSDKHQQYIDDMKQGYFDKKRRLCVLKIHQVCTVQPKLYDQRWTWFDFDYDPNATNAASNPSTTTAFQINYTAPGITVTDLRPIAYIRACVKNAFCFIDNSSGLYEPEIYRNRCICTAGHFPTHRGECRRGAEKPNTSGFILAFILALTGALLICGVLNSS